MPAENPRYRKEGTASWYGEAFHGRLTANGEIFDMGAISAAHPTLPLPSYVRVTNLRNGRSIVARLNDRGPFHDDRIIDVSERTAQLLGFHGNGTARVRVEYVGRASLAGSDDRKLLASLHQDGTAPVRVASAAPFVPSSPDASAQASRPAATARLHSPGGKAPRPAEPTAAARIERTLGPLPVMGSVADPATAPSAGVLSAHPAALSFAPVSMGTGPAFMSGRGLY